MLCTGVYARVYFVYEYVCVRVCMYMCVCVCVCECVFCVCACVRYVHAFSSTEYLFELRSACYKYFQMGGMAVSGPVGLLSV